jgi:hypothetical protein
VNGLTVHKKRNLPVKLYLASAVDPDEMPTIESKKMSKDPRPDTWLKGEIDVAKRHGFGILKALCTAYDFGLILVDGGAFTGDAEWEAINTHCGKVPWIAFDDTHAKTVNPLIDAATGARRHQWEVVYEELVDSHNPGYLGDGFIEYSKRHYDFSNGTRGGGGWWRNSNSTYGKGVEQFVEENHETPRLKPVYRYRNFALLRNRLYCGGSSWN